VKKVLIVMTSLYNGGAERSLVNMLNEFPSDKYEIDLLLFKRSGMFLSQIPDYVNVLETPADLQRMYGTLKESGVWLLWRLVGNAFSTLFTKNTRQKRGMRWKYFYTHAVKKMPQKYDVAIAYISGEILYYVDEKVDAEEKIVWIHNDYRSAGHPRKYDYPHLKNMSAIVSISDHCVDIIKEEFPEFADKTVMLENITSAKALWNRAEEFVPPEFDCENVVLSIGRLHEQKGFDMAIEAAAILKDRKVAFKWFVLGSGELKEELEAQIRKKNVEDYFILLGARENPYPYTKNCTIFVQPSRYEGKSVVLDEAKILAKPILATAYPTVGDQLVDGKEGLVVEMSPEGIADGIQKLLADPKMREGLQEYLMSQKYDNCDEIEKYCKLIDGV